MLRFPVKALRRRGPVWKFAGEAYVGDKLCAEAEFSAMIRDARTAMTIHPTALIEDGARLGSESRSGPMRRGRECRARRWRDSFIPMS